MLTIGRVIKCKAAVAWKPGEELSIEEIEVDLPKAGEVRVKILACSVCRTDAYALSGKDAVAVFPVVLGHEGAGIVESVGEGVTTVKPGDQVLPLCIPQCKTCELCLNPKTNLCQAQITQRQGLMSDGTTRFRCKGQELFHFMGCSTFSEFTVVPEISVCKIHDRFRLDKVCIISCSAMTGYGAAINTAKVKPGSSCAVFGLGAVGLSVFMGCKAASAERIICVDLSPEKFDRAIKFGVNEFVNPNDYDKPIQEVLIEMTDGGLDYTFDCTGNVNSMRAALEAAHKSWGVSVIVGVEEAGEEISIQPFQLVTGREWKGSYYGGYKSRDSMPKLFDICLNPRGKLHIYDLTTHRVQFKDIDKAFRLMHEGKSIRTIVDFQYFSFKYY